MIFSSPLDTFDEFRPLAWTERGLLRSSRRAESQRSRFPAKRVGLDLFRFLQRGIAIVGMVTGAGSATAEAPSNVNELVITSNPSFTLSIDASNLNKRSLEFRGASQELIPAAASVASSATQQELSMLGAIGIEMLSVIGEIGKSRLSQFERLPAAWDGKGSLPLQTASIREFDQFMRATKIFPPDASVFLSHRGEAILSWLDQQKMPVELRFTGQGVELFEASTNRESTYGTTEWASLVDSIGITKTIVQNPKYGIQPFDLSTSGWSTASIAHFSAATAFDSGFASRIGQEHRAALVANVYRHPYQL